MTGFSEAGLAPAGVRFRLFSVKRALGRTASFAGREAFADAPTLGFAAVLATALAGFLRVAVAVLRDAAFPLFALGDLEGLIGRFAFALLLAFFTFLVFAIVVLDSESKLSVSA